MNFPLVGAFVIALGALVMAGIIWLASGGAFKKNYDFYSAVEDESVDGLTPNAAVKYNGVTVGKVQSIGLDPSNQERVQLLFAIERGTVVKVDTVATLKTQGLTGIAYVELSGGAPGAAILEASSRRPYPTIATKPSLSARLENVLTTVLAKLDHTSSDIDALLSDQNRAAIGSTLADIAVLSHTLASHKADLDMAIVSAARTFQQTEHASARMGPVIDRIGQGADAIQRLGDQGANASESVNKAVNGIDRNARDFSAQTLPEIQQAVSELNDLLASLRRLSEQTERNPSSFIFGVKAGHEGPGETQSGSEVP